MALMLAGCTGSTAPSTTTTKSSTTTTSTITTTHVTTTSTGLHCGGGPDFFSPADLATVTRWFGPNQLCLRWTHTWVVLVSSSMNAPSPGGAVLLVDTCRSTDFRCLQNGTPHPLSDFRAYPLPDPTVVGAQVLGRYVNDTLWVVPDNRCGGVVFDLNTDHFYADGSAAANQLVHGHPAKAVPALSAPTFPANESPLPKASSLPSWCRGR